MKIYIICPCCCQVITEQVMTIEADNEETAKRMAADDISANETEREKA